jgi:hypothetical protein
MTMRRRVAYPELPMDLVDAAGLFGAFAGILSVGLSFFLGLTVALGAVLVAAALIRSPPISGRGGVRGGGPHGFLVAFAAAGAAWGAFFVHPASLDRWVGAILGVAGLPMWWVARRGRPFGGE